MGVGRRLSSGGGRNQKLLKRHIELCRNKCSTADDVVDHLRQYYPHYSRMDQRNLSKQVQQVLKTLPSPPRQAKKSRRSSRSTEDQEEEFTPANRTQSRKKKRRGIEESEEEMLLQRRENGYSKRISQNEPSSSSSSSESDSESDSPMSSTSADAVYGEEMKPKFDLMKSMLRESYGGKEPKQKNIELEVATDTQTNQKKIAMINGSKGDEGGEIWIGNSRKEVSKEKAQVSSYGDGGEVKEKEGPRFRDLGGMEEVLKELEMEVFVPLYYPHVPQQLGVSPIGGILLHGPPGCGKTKLAHAIANETGVPFYKISATEVVSGISGASEENIRELFTKAYRTTPSIIFIDEIDAIASKRENLQKEMEKRIVTQLMTCMDDYHKLVQPSDSNSDPESSENKLGYVLVIGATNMPDAIDPALRRPGRFDREIRLGVPDENARVQILSVLTKKCTLEGSFDLLQIARSTPGFVGADLKALVDKAGNLAMKRILAQRKSEIFEEYTKKEHIEGWWKVPWSSEEIEKLAITMADFEEAAKLVQPSSRREGFSTIPNVKWEDVGGLHSVRKDFELCILGRVKSPEIYQKFGVNMETGILLYGPPGCGKTLIAKAVANEAGANFIHIKGPELLNKYVGESELAVRTLFTRARTCSPCILFFDEVDALTTKRGKEGGWVIERLLNQLLIELDGADQRKGVFVIGATNRPEVMDPAVLRPGRFGKHIYLPLPSPEDRGLILKAHSRGRPIDPNLCLSSIGNRCEKFSGADLKNLMDEAAMAALVEATEEGSSEQTPFTIKLDHFDRALSKISPSVSEKQIHSYKIWSESFKA